MPRRWCSMGTRRAPHGPDKSLYPTSYVGTLYNPLLDTDLVRNGDGVTREDWMLLYSSHIERLDYEARARGMAGLLPSEEKPTYQERMAMESHGLIARDRLSIHVECDPLYGLEGAPEIPDHLSGYTRDEPELGYAEADQLVIDLKLTDPWSRMPTGFARRAD